MNPKLIFFGVFVVLTILLFNVARPLSFLFSVAAIFSIMASFLPNGTVREVVDAAMSGREAVWPDDEDGWDDDDETGAPPEPPINNMRTGYVVIENPGNALGTGREQVIPGPARSGKKFNPNRRVHPVNRISQRRPWYIESEGGGAN